MLDQDCRRCFRSFGAGRSAHHITPCGVTNLVATRDPARYQEIGNRFWHQRTIGQLEASPRGGRGQNAVAVDQIGADAYTVVKPALMQHICFPHVVRRIDFVGIPGTQCHTEFSEFCAWAR